MHHLLHHHLCSHGGFRVPDVWFKSSVTNKLKPSDREAELKGCHIHDPSNPISKYALMVTPIVNATENRFPYLRKKRSYNHLVRTTLVFSTIIIAMTIPFFGSLMSLVGAFLSVTASGIYREFGVQLVIIIGIVLIGISAGVMGVGYSE